MRYLLLSLGCMLLLACQQENKAFADKVVVADSLAINFYKGDGSMDTVVAVKIVRDKAKINQLSTFIAAAPASAVACGFDGSIHYFKGGMVLQDVDFRMNDVQCRHFLFKLNGQSYTTQLSPEAQQLLISLR